MTTEGLKMVRIKHDSDKDNEEEPLTKLPPMTSWSTDGVESWLTDEGYPTLAKKFKKHDINGGDLAALSPEDFKEIGIKNVGLRRRIIRRINDVLLEDSKEAQKSSKGSTEFAVEAFKLLPDIKRGPRQAVVGFLFHAEEFLDSPIWKQLILAFSGGAYIAFGAALSIVLSAGVEAPGPRRLLTSLGFIAGFSMVILTGSALFTEINVLIPDMILLRLRSYRHICRKCFRFWALVYIGNIIGSLTVAFVLWLTNALEKDSLNRLDDIVFSKMKYADKGVGSWFLIVASGILGNWLVGIAALLAQTARTLISKVVAVFLPVMTFVSLGVMHAPANMGYLFLGLMEGKGDTTILKVIVWNLLPASIGNLLGGVIMVGLFYWVVFAPPKKQLRSSFPELFKNKASNSRDEVQLDDEENEGSIAE